MRVPPTQKRPKKAVSPLRNEMYRFPKSAKNAKFGGSRFLTLFSIFDIKKIKRKVIFKRALEKRCRNGKKVSFLTKLTISKSFKTDNSLKSNKSLKRVKKRLELIPKNLTHFKKDRKKGQKVKKTSKKSKNNGLVVRSLKRSPF